MRKNFVVVPGPELYARMHKAAYLFDSIFLSQTPNIYVFLFMIEFPSLSVRYAATLNTYTLQIQVVQ